MATVVHMRNYFVKKSLNQLENKILEQHDALGDLSAPHFDFNHANGERKLAGSCLMDSSTLCMLH